MFLFKKQKSNDLEYNLNEQCLVCKHILENNEQILYIKRNKDDGKYQCVGIHIQKGFGYYNQAIRITKDLFDIMNKYR